MKHLHFQWILIVFLVFLPFQFALNITETIDLASIRLIIIGGFLFWFSWALFSKNLSFPRTFIFWTGLSFLFLVNISFLWAQETSWALRKILFLNNFFLLYVGAVWMFFAKKWTIDFFAKSLSWAGFLSALFALFQFSLPYFIGISQAITFWREKIAPFFLGNVFSDTVTLYSSWAVNVGGLTIFRAIGAFPDPHMGAFFWEICFVWSVFYAIQHKSLLYGLFSGGILLALFLTFSRGAYMGIFLVGVSMFVFSCFYYKKTQTVLILAFISLFALFSFLPSNLILERTLSSFSLTDTSNQGRLFMWWFAWDVLQENPWGVGVGGYALEVLPSAQYRDPIYAHNLYLDIMVEAGLLAGIFFILWIAQGIFIGYKVRKKMIYGWAIMFSLSIFSLHAFFDTPLYSVHVLPLFLMVMAVASSLRMKT